MNNPHDKKTDDDFISDLQLGANYNPEEIGTRKVIEKERTSQRLLSLKNRRKSAYIHSDLALNNDDDEKETSKLEEKKAIPDEETSQSKLKKTLSDVKVKEGGKEKVKDGKKKKLTFADDIIKGDNGNKERLKMFEELIRWDAQKDAMNIDNSLRVEPKIEQCIKAYVSMDNKQNIMQEDLIEKCIIKTEEINREILKVIAQEPITERLIEPYQVQIQEEPIIEAEINDPPLDYNPIEIPELPLLEQNLEHKEQDPMIPIIEPIQEPMTLIIKQPSIIKPSPVKQKQNRVSSLTTRIVKSVAFDKIITNKTPKNNPKSQSKPNKSKPKTSTHQSNNKPNKTSTTPFKTERINIKTTKEDFFERQRDFISKVDAKRKKLSQEIRQKETQEIIPFSNYKKSSTKESKDVIIQKQLISFNDWERKRIEKITALQRAKKQKEENEMLKTKKTHNRSVDNGNGHIDLDELCNRLYKKEMIKRKEHSNALQNAYKPSFKPTINSYVTNNPLKTTNRSIPQKTMKESNGNKPKTDYKDKSRNQRDNEEMMSMYTELILTERNEDELIRGKLFNSMKLKRNNMTVNQPKREETETDVEKFNNYFTTCNLTNYTQTDGQINY